jgi:hypothetical protein
MTNVLEKIDEFRDLINDLHRLVDTLIDRGKDWYILCSAMDVISHSENAIIHYENNLETDDLGNIYLSIYGLFQAFVVQQDAVDEIFKILELKKEICPDLDFIRDIRNDSSGHPVNRNKVASPRSNFFYSLEWTKEKFTLNRAYHNDQKDDFIDIYPLDLIQKQRTTINKYLIRLISVLKERENEHRKNFMSTSIKEIFNGSRYCFEKINTYLLDASTPFPLVKAHFVELYGYLEKFKNELNRRGISIDSLPGLKISIEELEHPIKRLHQYFIENDEIDIKDLFSFARHSQILLEEIIEMAEELDMEYSEKL